jgi:hypothetical protein
MALPDGLDRAQRLLAARFEADGPGFLYRSKPTAPPIRVSAAERDELLALVGRRLRWLYWGMMAAIVVVIGGYFAIAVRLNLDLSEPTVFAAMGAVFVAYMSGWRWIWTTPRRMFEGRVAAGAGRTRDEARQAAIAKMTWSRLGGAALILGLAIGRTILLREDVLHGWGRLWLVLFAAGFGVLAFGVYRKWRFDREAVQGPSSTTR